MSRGRKRSDDASQFSLPGMDADPAPVAVSEAPAETSIMQALDDWQARGWLRPLDRALVALFQELSPQTDPLVLLAAALTSHQLGHGHVCLDVAATLAQPDYALSLPPEGERRRDATLPSQLLRSVTHDAWLALLRASDLVDAGERDGAPMVLAGDRLYLRRYWTYELQVAAALRERLREPLAVPGDLPARLNELFGPPAPDATDWQKIACAVAARGRFTLITGGPGTGKTTTVVRLLGLLQAPAVKSGQPLRIRLAAPTGKAAARLSESIAAQVSRLAVDEATRAAIPTDVSTLHRLLGTRPDTRRFRHHRGEPLALDVLVVDEASMIDLEMMASVLDALPSSARLILLGDKDQLASVEAGAVLGDLCRDAEAGNYRDDTIAWLQTVTGAPVTHPALRPGDSPLAQQTVMLRHSRRFGADSGIGRLADAVNRQDAVTARQLLAQGLPDARGLQAETADRAFADLLTDGHPEGGEGYAHYLTVLRDTRPPAGTAPDDPAWEAWAAGVLAAFDRFRLLCALRRGAWGVEGLNAHVATTLRRRGLLESDHGWYEGRPVLSTRNDYSLGLMNGDIGIALRLPGPHGTAALRVAFPRADRPGGARFILPSRIGDIDTVFAMTVHKSQGSEFDHTVLALPPVASPVMTKELVYTGITRARRWFTLVESGQGVFDEAVMRRVTRVSGLTVKV